MCHSLAVVAVFAAGLPMAATSAVRPGPKPAAPPLCPVSVPSTAALLKGEDTRLGLGPTALRLCGYSGGGPLKGGDNAGNGVVLGAGPAGVVATLIVGSPPAAKAERRCAQRPPEVLLRFVYRSGAVVDAGLVEPGCPPGSVNSLDSGVVFFGSKARSLDPGLTSTLVADAGAYGRPRPPATPELFGYTVAKATEKAHRSGFVAEFGGEAVDGAYPPGVVLLQFPPAGTGDIGNEVDLVLSVPPSSPCVPADLALVYGGQQGATGNLVGNISMWDISHQYCLLVGPLRLVGTDPSGRALTRALVYDVSPGMVLSPEAHPRGPGSVLPIDELVAGLAFATPTAANCLSAGTGTRPAKWQLSLPGGDLTVANAGGLNGAFIVDCGSLGPFGPVSLW